MPNRVLVHLLKSGKESANRPVKRFFSFQEVLNRVTEAERKELIQLLLFIAEVAKGPPTLERNESQIGDWERRIHYDNPRDSEIGVQGIVEGNEEENSTNNEENTEGEEEIDEEEDEEEKERLGNDKENHRYEAFGWSTLSPDWSEFA